MKGTERIFCAFLFVGESKALRAHCNGAIHALVVSFFVAQIEF